MAAPVELTPAELAAINEPSALLERAWELEPWARYVERAGVLDRLEQLLGVSSAIPAPPGRDWRLELLAERAIDAGRSRRMEQANAMVYEVLRDADPSHQIALGRGMLAKGQLLAWAGTDDATRASHRAFAAAAEHFAALGNREWQGSALLRRGYSSAYQHGDLVIAEELMRAALETYAPDSSRLPGALTPYADVLIDLGEFEQAEVVIERAVELAERHGFEKTDGESAWGKARIAAARGDASATERFMREAERASRDQDWFATHIGTSFLLDAAEVLDLVGLSEQVGAYLEQALERADAENAGAQNDEVLQTLAVLGARNGDPLRALEDLQQLARGEWLEKRVVWRHTLLTAWATFRAGREGAGQLAARALQQAADCGSVRVAVAGEPDIVAALIPAAEKAGSAHARELLLSGRLLLVKLFGAPRVTDAEGNDLTLPPGMPGELVRLLALQEHGLPVDVVLEIFFPEAPATAARQRLRQVLTRLRSAAGDVIVRDGEMLRLVPAWVDAREFLSAANRVRAARGAYSVRLSYCALALADGPLLPTDPYAEWAKEIREQVRYRELAMLDLIAADAEARGSHHEALTAIEAALREDPDNDGRQAAIAEQLRALGQHRAAGHVVRRGGAATDST